MSRILAVANQKGGVGKTTTVINLGAYMAEAGKSVLIVDADPQGNATTGLGISKDELNASLYHVLMEEAVARDAVVPTPVPGLDLLPSTVDLAGAEIELVTVLSRERRIETAVHPLLRRYDYVLIDCPPSLGLMTINALTAAHGVLVPIQCEYYALEGMSQLMNTIMRVRRALNPALTVEGIILTMFDGRTNLSIQVADEVKRHFRGQVFRSVIPRNVRLSEAPSHGSPISVYDPKSKGAEQYRELAKEVLRAADQKRIG